MLCNGAYILDSNNKILNKEYIDKKLLLFLIEKFWDNPELYFLFITDQLTYTNQLMLEPPFGEYQKILRSQIKTKREVLKTNLSILNIEVHGKPEELHKIEKAIQDEKISSVKAQFSWSNFMEIYSKQASKGKALQTICSKENLKKENVLAFGDGNNDIDLFKESGFSVAMKNATDTLKKFAQFTTEDYNNDGVGLFLEDYVL